MTIPEILTTFKVSNPHVRRFSSGIGKRSPFNAYREGHLLVVLRMYFDGANLKTPEALPAYRNLLTLAAYAADDSAWAEFENGWEKILAAHPLRPEYMHMNEAITLNGEFSIKKGWTHAAVRELIASLAKYSSGWRDTVASCSVRVDIDAFGRVKKRHPNIQPAKRIMIMHCVAPLFLEYIKRIVSDDAVKIAVVNSIDLYFDQNEVFKAELERLINQHSKRMKETETREQWERLRTTGQLFWHLLSAPVPVDMTQHPPVQLADMLAWSENRLNARGDWTNECLAVTDAIPGKRLVYGEADLTRLAKRNA